MISDDGAIDILDSLKSFVLTEQELVDSKGRLLQYLKKKNGLINALTKEILKAELEKKTVKKKVAKPATTTLLRKNKQLEKELSKDQVRRSFEKPIGELRSRAESLADSQLGFFSDPFSAENIYTVGKTAFCYGNNSLRYLNLAYNDLTYASIKVLYEVVATQRNICRVPRGLVNVVIEGNCMPTECEELQKIDDMLSSYLFYHAPRQSIVKRRPSVNKL
uniref:Uncharacterized protein n=1 Tax=Heliothis virescens TaxID=7102 RepID=A0A2A4JVH3_HELVI